MKKTLSIIGMAVATATLVSPLAFPKVIAGCGDDSYRFRTMNTSSSQLVAADQAKNKFCHSAKAALENARMRVHF